MTGRTINGLAIVLALALLSAAPLEAGSVTLAWDPNSETDLAGYRVSWGAQSGIYTAYADVGNVTTYEVMNLPDGVTYYFVVQAYNLSGLYSSYSNEVGTVVGMPVNVGTWMARFGVTDMNADDDGDGVINQAEYDQQTDPTIPNNWYLAEGATGFFNERLAIVNPGTDPADITVTFLPEGGAPITRTYSVAAQSRSTVNVQTIPGLGNTSLSATVTANRGGVVVERSMFWSAPDGQLYAGHTGKAVPQPQTQWYFAEGDSSVFDAYLLLGNANAQAATVDVTYLLDNGTTLARRYTVNARSRYTIFTNWIPEVVGHSFSATVMSTLPITAERAMYLTRAGRQWKVGHDAAGISAPANDWFVAEGHTGSYFDVYLLLGNPNPSQVTATIRFLRPTLAPIVRTYTLQPNSRTTVYVDGIPGLEDTDVSASITATQAIVVERAMYWPGNWATWHEGHVSAAVTQTGTRWALAEGEKGGSASYMSFILLANPNATDAQVRLTLLRESGAPVVSTHTVRANSRMTLYTDQFTAIQSGERFGALVESTNSVPIIVERSMYWNAIGLYWSGGTNETGVRLR